MNIHFSAWIAFFALASFVGFFADRTSICTVKAVEEIITTRRAYMLLSFAKTVLWVTGIGIWIVWWLGVETPERLGFPVAWTGILGGVLFGLGAVLNEGCAISTIARLGNGNFGMIVTMCGFVAGVAAYELIDGFVPGTGYDRAAPWIELTHRSAMVLGVSLTLWMVWEITRLWRTAPTAKWWTLLLSPRFRLSTGAAVIGVSNGILFALLGTWAYTHTLRRSAGEVLTPVEKAANLVPTVMLWWLFLALLVGVLVSSFLNRHFVLAWRPRRGWKRYFGGGVLMGIGAALIPGGNDVLLLNSIPGRSPHAVSAYFAMLVGIAIGLLVVKRRGGRVPVVNCSGDQCDISDER